MTDTQAPTGPEAILREVLNDAEKTANVFGKNAVENGTTAKFLDAYASVRTSEYEAELTAKLQNNLLNQVRAEGTGRNPGVDLGVTVQDGRPGITVNGKSVATGRGAAYNKAAPGARMEDSHGGYAKGVADGKLFASMGEYCQAIREEARPSNNRRRNELLAKLENVRSFMNSFSSEDPGAGGFLIPEILRSELMHLAIEESIVRARATVIPMNTLRVPIPTVDETSHASNVFGGVQFYWAEESASITESTATFGKVVLDAKKLAGFFKVPNELLADAPAFSAFFDTRIPAGLAWFEDLAFLTETGAGTPMGVIGSQNPAYTTVTRTTSSHIKYADLTNMYQRMLPTSLKNAVWVASIDCFSELAQMTLSTPGIWMGGYNASPVSDAPPISIFGRPVYFTEKVSAMGTVGDISFVDMSYYLVGDRQSVEVSASEHAFFQNDQTAYKLVERVDGRPWVQSALTPHNGSTNKLSPYVGIAT